MDIGSGPVEAACKTLVTQRMKISGAQWLGLIRSRRQVG
jgi:hypothetical protein